MLINSSHLNDKWCYAVETAADACCCLLHSAIDTSPYHAWYQIVPSVYDFCICKYACALTTSICLSHCTPLAHDHFHPSLDSLSWYH